MGKLLKKIWKGTKKAVGIGLQGAGSVLSLVNPSIGGVVSTVGQNIGASLTKAGGKISGDKSGAETMDKVANYIDSKMEKWGMREPATVQTKSGTMATFMANPVMLIAIGGIILLLLLRRK